MRRSAITVDAQLNRHAISPLIYGVAFASSSQLADLNCPPEPFRRQCRDPLQLADSTRTTAAPIGISTASATSPATPAAAADNFVTDSKNGGAEPMLTIPMIGWVPKLGPGRGKLASYSIAKYGPQTGSDSQWMPDAGNGISTPTATSLITWNDPNDANFLTNSAFQQALVQHLTNRWGSGPPTAACATTSWITSTASGTRPTGMSIPAGATMQEIRDKFFDYAGNGESHGPQRAGPRRRRNGAGPAISTAATTCSTAASTAGATSPTAPPTAAGITCPGCSSQFHQRATNTNQRLLDYFTLHRYPAGRRVGGNDVSTATQLLRNRWTRRFWDTNYVDEAWIGSSR